MLLGNLIWKPSCRVCRKVKLRITTMCQPNRWLRITNLTNQKYLKFTNSPQYRSLSYRSKAWHQHLILIISRIGISEPLPSAITPQIQANHSLSRVPKLYPKKYVLQEQLHESHVTANRAPMLLRDIYPKNKQTGYSCKLKTIKWVEIACYQCLPNPIHPNWTTQLWAAEPLKEMVEKPWVLSTQDICKGLLGANPNSSPVKSATSSKAYLLELICLWHSKVQAPRVTKCLSSGPSICQRNSMS